MNKFEVGTQWRTRGGWRAVVVREAKGGKNLSTWQDSSRDGDIVFHKECGKHFIDDDYDLIEPWKEPREYTTDIVLYEYEDDGELCVLEHDTTPGEPVRKLATKRITIKEGEFIDADIR